MTLYSFYRTSEIWKGIAVRKEQESYINGLMEKERKIEQEYLKKYR